jgi:hypothetical protein
MAAWRDLPRHTAAPPDGGHSVTMAHHVGQARCVRGGGILLFFRGQGRRVISSLTHVRVRRLRGRFTRVLGPAAQDYDHHVHLTSARKPLEHPPLGQRRSFPPPSLLPPCCLVGTGCFMHR